MITKTKLNIVLDIGKTNVKLIFVDAKNTTVCSYKTQQKSINQYGIKTLNSNSIFEWTIKKISLIENIYVQEFNKNSVYLRIKYLGKLEKIMEQLKNEKIILKLSGDDWSIKII